MCSVQIINGAEAVAGQGAEKKLERAFNSAQANAPAVLLIDEIDAIIPSRYAAHQMQAKHIQFKSCDKVVVIPETWHLRKQ